MSSHPQRTLKMALPFSETVKICHHPGDLYVFLKSSPSFFQGVATFERHLAPVLERIVFPDLEFPVRSSATDHQIIAGHFPWHPCFDLRLYQVIVSVSSLDLFQTDASKELFGRTTIVLEK